MQEKNHSDEQLMQLVSQRPDYKAPILYDSELSNLVDVLGRKMAAERTKMFYSIVLGGCLVGFISGIIFSLAGFPFSSMYVLLVFYFGSGFAIGLMKAEQVRRSFQSRQYDVAAKLLPDALAWSLRFYPFTAYSFRVCDDIQNRLLLLEGRMLELEVYTRFLMPFLKAKNEKIRLRLNCNIWLGWLMSGRYDEVVDAINSVDLQTVEPLMRTVLLNNLTFCQIKSGNFKEAAETLERAFTNLASSPQKNDPRFTSRLHHMRAMIQIEQGDLVNSESALEEAMREAKKQSDNEGLAHCMVSLGRLRQKQKRFDEAKLHFKNAIEFFSGADNTQYISLCVAMHCYAQMLLESGETKSALNVMNKVLEYNEGYNQREERTRQRLISGLRNTEKIRTYGDLMTFSEREPLVELGTSLEI